MQHNLINVFEVEAKSQYHNGISSCIVCQVELSECKCHWAAIRILQKKVEQLESLVSSDDDDDDNDDESLVCENDRLNHENKMLFEANCNLRQKIEEMIRNWLHPCAK